MFEFLEKIQEEQTKVFLLKFMWAFSKLKIFEKEIEWKIDEEGVVIWIYLKGCDLKLQLYIDAIHGINKNVDCIFSSFWGTKKIGDGARVAVYDIQEMEDLISYFSSTEKDFVLLNLDTFQTLIECKITDEFMDNFNGFVEAD